MTYRPPTKEERNQAFLKEFGADFGYVQAYAEESVEQKKTFLIVCEGLNTEKAYFESFPVPSKEIIVQGGKGSKNTLVDYTIRIMKEPDHEGREVWCVYDFDVKPDEGHTQPQDFNSSIQKAQANGIRVAWSNDAFELWFLLHYQDLQAGLTRHDIYPKLKEYWKIESFSKEAKKLEFCQEHYERHARDGASQEAAIKRAKALHEQYDRQENYAEQCPCTTVYLLVEELNKNTKRGLSSKVENIG